ncbi:2-isopropylmalate synthase [Altererythrobacter epoxidivorans]|uniref:2-isopropylmalate synthase n=1 Tax=Altererythrobacter epoxidivorans TaxID=361183 RepID=A0A0M3TA86_9SPHN|nr:2-isopropylmalate synthase [Altererythrobacter epoxidivorans]
MAGIGKHGHGNLLVTRIVVLVEDRSLERPARRSGHAASHAQGRVSRRSSSDPLRVMTVSIADNFPHGKEEQQKTAIGES